MNMQTMIRHKINILWFISFQNEIWSILILVRLMLCEGVKFAVTCKKYNENIFQEQTDIRTDNSRFKNLYFYERQHYIVFFS